MQELTPAEIEESRAYHQARDARRRAESEAHRTTWLARVQRTVGELAPDFPALRAVYLYGSLAQPGRFHTRSDIDLAVLFDRPDSRESLESESAFWAALERHLDYPCDVRPLVEPIRTAVAHYGILLYERTPDAVDQYHSE